MRARLGTRLERRHGNGTIIAIDVDVRDYMGVDPALERLSVRSALRGMFRWGRSGPPGIGDILYRASHIGGLHQRPRAIALSDHYLEPPVASFALMAYGRAQQIAEVGYRYAMQEIAAWGRDAGAAG